MSLLRGDDPAAIAAAAQRLAQGGLVAFPTETVYGLGARADDDAAVSAIFAAKGRPTAHPLIVHVTGLEAAERFAAQMPAAALRLAQAFWPGPVTVIVPRRPGMAAAAAGGQDSIGLRCPAHPVAQALLAAAADLGVLGLAAPSANRFGRVSPTRAAHVQAEFNAGLMVLDGGDCPVGIESTIIDTTRGRPVLLRPGQLTRASIEAALGEPLIQHAANAGAALGPSPRAPGTLASHYAPRARVRLLDRASLTRALHDGRTPSALAVYSRQPTAMAQANHSGVLAWWPMPDDPAAVAQELFAVLRALDDQGAEHIWIEQPPDQPDWEGVLDRLRRAAA